MTEYKKTKLEAQNEQLKEENELSDDDLSSISGGTMKDHVYITKTSDISDSTRERM